VATVLAAVVGIGSAVLMPRGPITAFQAVGTTIFAFAIGIAVGRIMRTRWSLFWAPLAFLAAFEVARQSSGVTGPTVNTVRVDTFYGVLA
jgi:hypothetical protein